MPQCRNGATSWICCTVPRRSSGAARISGVTVEREIGGEDGHLEEHAPGSLGVDEHQVIVALEDLPQMPQAQPPVRRMQQKRVEITPLIVRQDEVEVRNRV